tara:strand:- start:1546 stop:2145 length:600 start_codon:yes stop_codon:yes gene_type:complete
MGKSRSKSKSGSTNSRNSKNSTNSKNSRKSRNLNFMGINLTDGLLIIIVLLVVFYVLMDDNKNNNNNNNNKNNNNGGPNVAGFSNNEPFQNNKNNNNNNNNNNNEVKLMLFHAKWCGYCTQFMPKWEELKGTLDNTKTTNGKTIKLHTYESEEKEIMTQYNIKGYPTIKCSNHKGKVLEFKGDRESASDIKEFIEKCSK